MKPVFLILTLLIMASVVSAQMVSGGADIITVYSQNERFYLKSIPYDDESPSLKGETSVYEKGKPTPLYTLNRGFDVDDNVSSLFLSNDGEVIFYVVQWGGDEAKDGLKSVNVYKSGKLIRSFTESEITGCNKKKERCKLVYSNFDQVVDLKTRGKSGRTKQTEKRNGDAFCVIFFIKYPRYGEMEAEIVRRISCNGA
jgi:hypothetical protein